MRIENSRLIRLIVALFICGVFFTQSIATVFAEETEKANDPVRCKQEIQQTIKLLKKGEILNFSGKKMLKALKSYEDGISKQEFKQLDKVMGPFDDNFKTMKKIYQNIQDIKEACE